MAHFWYCYCPFGGFAAVLHTQSRRSIKRAATNGSSPMDGTTGKTLIVDMSFDSWLLPEKHILFFRWPIDTLATEARQRDEKVAMRARSSLHDNAPFRRNNTSHTQSYIFFSLFLSLSSFSTFPIKVVHDRKKVRQNPSGRVALRRGKAHHNKRKIRNKTPEILQAIQSKTKFS